MSGVELPSGQVSAGSLSRDAIPLGPWAGAQVAVWASKTGAVWHADPDCRELRSRARQEVHLQPTEGSMADRRLPGRLHCTPPGPLADYAQAVEASVRFDAATAEALTRFQEEGRLSLDVFDGLDIRSEEVRATLESSLLADSWKRCQERRSSLSAKVQGALGERLPLMLAAAWVLSGKTPRKHQDRYNAFLVVLEDEFDSRSITPVFGSRAYANQGALPWWLEEIAAGGAPEHVTARLAQKEADQFGAVRRDLPADLPQRVSEALVRAGEVWLAMLEGIVLAHDGEILAIFHEDQLPLLWETRNLFDTVLPCSRLRTREFSWVVARVPAVMALLLRERERGLVGLVLEQERAHVFDVAKGALFLRNAVTLLERPELADHVEADTTASGPETAPGRPSSGLDWQLHGFGNGFMDGGLTREQFLPALRMAWDGVDVRTLKRGGRRRKA